MLNLLLVLGESVMLPSSSSYENEVCLSIKLSLFFDAVLWNGKRMLCLLAGADMGILSYISKINFLKSVIQTYK